MRVLAFLQFLFLVVSSSQAQSLYDKENSSEFAIYLYRSGQYKLAAIEYERLLFMEPNNDSLRVQLISCYSFDMDYRKAIDRIKLFPTEPSALSSPLADLYSYNLISAGGMQPARAFLTVNNQLPPKRKTYYQAYSYLLENDFEMANEVAINHPDELPSQTILLINESRNLKHRSAGLAAAMSAIVPGTGKFYTGDWKDAIIGLAAIGITGFQAYRGFNRNGIESTYGWIYGTLATGFYLGNIYGSYTSAQRFNKRQTDKIATRIQQSFILTP